MKTLTESKLRHVLILPIDDVKPSPENEELYRPVTADDPEIQKLARSISEIGLRESLVISEDRYVLSGHRRLKAAQVAGLRELPCIIEPITRGTDAICKNNDFISLLRQYNLQRDKTNAERIREEVVSIDPEAAWQQLIIHRVNSELKSEEGSCVQELEIIGIKERSKISKGKQPFLNAAIAVLEALRSFWPVSLRTVHYKLLNNPPLIHSSKPGSFYQNDRRSYQSLSELLTRARLEGTIPLEGVIDDTTRPVRLNYGFETVRPYVQREIETFLTKYRRNLQQNQPHHIEIMCEKDTLQNILAPVAKDFGIPLTIGRGYSSVPPKAKIARRYRESGKGGDLILLILSDLDPDGEEICQSFARSMRDDFNIFQVRAIRVALTPEQVSELQLPASMEAKKSSVHYDKFVEKNDSTYAYELEAVEPMTLQSMLQRAIQSVIDIEVYNREVEEEKQDAALLAAVRKQILQGINLRELGIEENSDMS